MVRHIFVPTTSNIRLNLSQHYRLTACRHFIMASSASNEQLSMKRKVLRASNVFSFKKLSGGICGCVRNEYCRDIFIPAVRIF